MTEPRQRSIGVTPQEKLQLEKAKALYQENTGERSDWGKFLAVTSLLALAALGVYRLVRANRSKPAITCPDCGIRFPVAYSGNLPPIVHVQCPSCGEELVIDFRQ
jgi:predicted RNA-binding Zn-ribbon protein involved in translation (DUF1610 family)